MDNWQSKESSSGIDKISGMQHSNMDSQSIVSGGTNVENIGDNTYQSTNQVSTTSAPKAIPNLASPAVSSTAVAKRDKRPPTKKVWATVLIFVISFAVIAVVSYFATVGVVTRQQAVAGDWTDGLVAQAPGTETWAGEGTLVSPYRLSTAIDLAQLAVNVNAGTTYAGEYFKLTNSVSLAGKYWTAIGTEAHPFMGNFDGGKNPIYFMTINKPNVDNQGFFGYVHEGNLTGVAMYNSAVLGKDYVGAVAGTLSNSNASYCCNDYIREDSEYAKDPLVQEIVSKDDFFDTTLTTTVTEVSADINTKRNTSATTSGSAGIGGCFGKINLSSGSATTRNVYGCYNTGNVTSTGAHGAGGIAGWQNVQSTCGDWIGQKDVYLRVYNCVNTGKITSTTSGQGGGIIGHASVYGKKTTGVDHRAYAHIDECWNAGIVTQPAGSNDVTKIGSILGTEYRAEFGLVKLLRDVWTNMYWPNRLFGGSAVDDSYNSTESTNTAMRCTSSSSLPTVFQTAGWTKGSWACFAPTTSTSGGYTVTKYYFPMPSQWSTVKLVADEVEVARTWTVTLNKQSGSNGTSSISVTYNASLPTISTPTRTGYTFQGYYTSTNGGGSKVYNSSGSPYISKWTFTSTTTLYAYWTVNSYTITYDDNGGTGGTDTQTKNYGSSVTIRTASACGFSRTGYTFSHWNTNSSGTGTNYYAGNTYSTNANLRLYAQWTRITYTISYRPNGGTGSNYSQTKNYGSSVSILSYSTCGFSRTGYTFSRWNTNSSGTGTNYYAGNSYSTNANLTLYAQWTINTYSVNYRPNGGMGSNLTDTKTYGQTLTLRGSTTYTRDGYDLIGWSTSSTATTPTYSCGGSYTSNSSVTLYAVWRLKTYTLRYYLNDGSGSLINTVTKTHGVNVTLPSSVSTRTGYTAIGWATSSTATTAQYNLGGTYSTNASEDFYVVWRVNSYTITVSSADSNAGTVSGGGSYDHFSVCMVRAIPNQHYEFLRWAENGVTVSTNADYSFEVSGARTLVAEFKRASYTVSGTTNYNGAAGVSGNGTYTYLDSVTLTALDIDTRFKFVEWRVDDAVVSEDREYTFVLNGNVSPVAIYELAFVNYDVNHISTLYWIADCVSNGYTFEGVTFDIRSDLEIGNVTDREWKTIGDASHTFAGQINGNGYQLTNVGTETITLFNNFNGEINGWIMVGDIDAGVELDSDDLLPPDEDGKMEEQYENANHGGR